MVRDKGIQLNIRRILLLKVKNRGSLSLFLFVFLWIHFPSLKKKGFISILSTDEQAHLQSPGKKPLVWR